MTTGSPPAAVETMPAGRWPVDGATVLNTLFGYGTFLLCCLTLPLFLPLVWVLPGGRRYWIAAAMRRGVRLIFWSAPTVTWRCDGELRALADARVVVANHEGMLDILAACALPGTRTLLSKTWVFRNFPMGVAARAAGLLNADDLTPDDYQEGGRTIVDPGVGMFIFPEGVRSRDGRLARFRPGAFVLADRLGAPVVPVAVAGSFLGIRPGSVWIHPSHVRSRVLPPMRRLPDEPFRQFAQRVRQAIAVARFALMKELLELPRLARNRLHFFSGVGGEPRRRVGAEHATGAWRALLAAAGDDEGDWLFLGCGWSVLPVTLRQLLPANRILACEPDMDRRAVALAAWCRTGDALTADLPSLPVRLAGLVVLPSVDAALVERLLAAVDPAAIPAVVVPAAQAEAWQSRLGGRAVLAVHGELAAFTTRPSRNQEVPFSTRPGCAAVAAGDCVPRTP